MENAADRFAPTPVRVTGRARVDTKPSRGLRRVTGRVGWTIGDQAVSSLTNAALSVLVARSVSEASFGAFAIAFLVYQLTIAASRSFVSEPFTVRFGDARPESFAAERRSAAGASIVVGLVVGAIVASFALTQTALLREPMLALALCLPGLLLQDALRLSFITEGRSRSAFANDVLWGIVQFTAVAGLLLTDTATTTLFVLSWGGAAAVAAAYGLAQRRTFPSLATAPGWLRAHFELSRFYIVESLTVLASFQLALLVVSAVAGVTAVAAIRGASVVLGPVNIVFFGIYAFAVPELVRFKAAPMRWHTTVATAISGSLLVAAGAWGGAMLLLPDTVGREILGDTWHEARSVLPAMTIALAGVGAVIGPICVLRAFAAVRETLFLGLTLAVLLLGLGTAGAIMGGAAGAAAAFAVAQWLPVPIAWQRMRAVLANATKAKRYDRDLRLREAG